MSAVVQILLTPARSISAVSDLNLRAATLLFLTFILLAYFRSLRKKSKCKQQKITYLFMSSASRLLNSYLLASICFFLASYLSAFAFGNV